MGSNWTYAVLYGGYFLGLFVFGLLINSILLRFIKTLGTKNQSGAMVRWSDTTKPAIGGLSFYIVFLVGLSFSLMLFDPDTLFDRFDLGGLFIAASLGFIMGLTDDAYNTKPFLKFAVQAICGIILIATGTQIELFDSDILNKTITVVWVVGIMNSINMLDNMDGIASVVSAFIILAGLGALFFHQRFATFEFMALWGVVAALGAFLFFNWHPSKIYMGDTGSQFLGVVLAYIGIHYCWNIGAIVPGAGMGTAVVALLTVFVLPLCDTTAVTINRLREGRSPFVGGKDHTTHHLSYRGIGDRGIAGLFALVSLISVGLYLLLFIFTPPNGLLLYTAYTLYFLLVFAALFGVMEHNKHKGKDVR